MKFDDVSPFYATRPLCMAAVCFGAGAYLGVHNVFSIWFLAALLISGVLLMLKKPYLALGAAMLFAGLVIASLAAHPRVPNAGMYFVTGTIKGDVTVNPETGQVRATLEDVTLDGASANASAYWSFYLDEGEAAPDIKDGDRVAFSGRVYEPMGRQNPYGFDFKLYLYQRGMTVGLFGRDGLSIEKQASGGLFHLAYHIRQALSNRLSDSMGENSPLAIAMTLGDKALLPEDDVEAFRNLGIAHILAISGLHVGYLIMLIGVAFRVFYVPRKVHLPVLAVFLFVYAMLTGLSDSVIRASVLALCMLLAGRLRRPYDGLTALSAAFILILAFRPLDIVSPGFVLTFGAVLGIVLLNEPITKRLSFLPKWLREALGVSLAAQLGILVPIMAYYQQAQPFSPLINLLAVPYAGVLTILYFLTLIFPFVSILAVPATQLLMFFVREMGKASFLTLATAAPTWYIWCGAFFIMALLSGYVSLKPLKRLAALGMVAVIMWAPAVFEKPQPPTYTLFANGQADGAIVEYGAYTLVIDVGDHGGDMASYLKSKNKAVDALILSHLHSDHVMGLSAFIKRGVQVKSIYLPHGYEAYVWDEGCLELVQGLDLPLQTLASGDELPHVSVLWPIKGAPPLTQDGNAISMGLLINLDGVRIITLGDLTTTYENYAMAPADVLKVSHHGSKTGTGDAFLDGVSPTVALISCNANALLPAKAVVDRLAQRDIATYRTDETGAVTIFPSESGYTVETFLP